MRKDQSCVTSVLKSLTKWICVSPLLASPRQTRERLSCDVANRSTFCLRQCGGDKVDSGYFVLDLQSITGIYHAYTSYSTPESVIPGPSFDSGPRLMSNIVHPPFWRFLLRCLNSMLAGRAIERALVG